MELIQFIFCRLYNEFAWAYDGVSSAVSRGEWRNWQRAALPYLQGARILEIGFGTGDLMLELFIDHRQAFGIDLSPAMVSIASHKLQNAGRPLNICRARIQALPFAVDTFNSLVLTFPGPFLFAKESQLEISRVLVPGGRLVIIGQGWLRGKDLWSRFLNWALRSTTVSKQAREKVEKAFSEFATVFGLHQEEMATERSIVQVWVGMKE
ncbi:MAG: class I SAM-dependent methyltransferase [Chloroflexi bacterium]|nr:class I SAM-dependent methyltransferase [Chloroflexota bacterium]